MLINRKLIHTVFELACPLSVGSTWLIYLLYRLRFKSCMIRHTFRGLNNKAYYILLLSIIFVSVAITGTAWFNAMDSSSYAIWVIGVSIINILITFVFEAILKIYVLYKKNNQLRELLDRQEHHYQKSVHTFNNIKKTIHDTQKHLLFIEKCIEENYLEGALEHIKKTRNRINHSHQIVRTGNLAIDAFVSNAISFARENSIQMDYSVNISLTDHTIDSYDLCILLGNILDNAITAAKLVEELDKRQLDLRIFTNNDALFIHVVNARTEDSEQVGPPVNSELHGIGLTIIQQVADKYNGHLKVNISNNEFEITVVLPFMNKSLHA